MSKAENLGNTKTTNLWFSVRAATQLGMMLTRKFTTFWLVLT